jgi:predicted dithiol-disulfide oxidoreductase (DUF899 family)
VTHATITVRDVRNARLRDLEATRGDALMATAVAEDDALRTAVADPARRRVLDALLDHDVAFTAVSRAPLAKLQDYKRRMGWSFPWASSFESDFNYDFHTSHTEQECVARHVPLRNDVGYPTSVHRNSCS